MFGRVSLFFSYSPDYPRVNLYPVIYQTRPVKEIPVFYTVYGECTRLSLLVVTV